MNQIVSHSPLARYPRLTQIALLLASSTLVTACAAPDWAAAARLEPPRTDAVTRIAAPTAQPARFLDGGPTRTASGGAAASYPTWSLDRVDPLDVDLGLTSLPPRRETGNVRVSTGAAFGGSTSGTGFLAHVEAEFSVGQKVTIAPRILHYAYDWEDDEGFFTEEEEGSGTGVGVEFRFYPREAMRGFYVGAQLAVFQGEWEFRQNGIITEEDDEVTFMATAGVGYVFRLGERFSLTPSIIIGTYESSSPESGVLAGGGLSFGLTF